MRYMILIFTLLISACAATPVAVRLPDFPLAPPILLKQCPDLNLAPSSDRLSDLLKVVAENYAEYHRCKAAVEAWNLWYADQKQNYEELIYGKMPSK